MYPNGTLDELSFKLRKTTPFPSPYFSRNYKLNSTSPWYNYNKLFYSERNALSSRNKNWSNGFQNTDTFDMSKVRKEAEEILRGYSKYSTIEVKHDTGPSRLQIRLICFFITLVFSLLALYYKKTKNKSRTESVNVEDDIRQPRMSSSRTRPAEATSSNGKQKPKTKQKSLSSQRNQLIQSQDEPLNLSTLNLASTHVAAQTMPMKPVDVTITTIAEINANENTALRTTHNRNKESDNYAVVYIRDDDRVPTYEEAIRKI